MMLKNIYSSKFFSHQGRFRTLRSNGIFLRVGFCGVFHWKPHDTSPSHRLVFILFGTGTPKMKSPHLRKILATGLNLKIVLTTNTLH